MQQPVPELTGGASWGKANICGSVSTGTAEGTAGAEHSGSLFLTCSFCFPLPDDFERAGTAPCFKSHIPVKCNCLMYQFLKVFHLSSSSFHRFPARKTKKGGSYLENCSEIPSRHLVHSSSSMFSIQCINLDTSLFKHLSRIVLHCCVP